MANRRVAVNGSKKRAVTPDVTGHKIEAFCVQTIARCRDPAAAIGGAASFPAVTPPAALRKDAIAPA
jgi:hypothetical protein